MVFGAAEGFGFAADLPWRGFDFFMRERLQEHVVTVYDSQEKRKVRTRTLENRKGAAPGLRRRCALGSLRRAIEVGYWILVQLAGAGASMRRLPLAGSKGTSWTAMLEAGTEPSLRMT